MKMGYEELRAVCVVVDGTNDKETRSRTYEAIKQSKLEPGMYLELSFQVNDAGIKNALKSKHQKIGK